MNKIYLIIGLVLVIIFIFIFVICVEILNDFKFNCKKNKEEKIVRNNLLEKNNKNFEKFKKIDSEDLKKNILDIWKNTKLKFNKIINNVINESIDNYKGFFILINENSDLPVYNYNKISTSPKDKPSGIKIIKYNKLYIDEINMIKKRNFYKNLNDEEYIFYRNNDNELNILYSNKIYYFHKEVILLFTKINKNNKIRYYINE